LRLIDLEPEFVKLDASDDSSFRRVEDITDADGVWFHCPTCFVANGNTCVGAHMILCWHPRVPAGINPGPGRWELLGSGYHDLTLRAGSSSVYLTGKGCGAHFFITNGEVIPC
jgi:hypothetical protein